MYMIHKTDVTSGNQDTSNIIQIHKERCIKTMAKCKVKPKVEDTGKKKTWSSQGKFRGKKKGGKK